MLCCSDATHEALTVQVQSSRASEADTATALEEAQSVQILPQLHRNIKLCCLQELRAALTAHEIMHQRAMELEVTYCSYLQADVIQFGMPGSPDQSESRVSCKE